MLVAFWIVSGLVALVFLAAGTMKLARPKEALVASGLAWTEDFTEPTVKAIGAAEVLGAIGIVLPALTGIAPILSTIAASPGITREARPRPRSRRAAPHRARARRSRAGHGPTPALPAAAPDASRCSPRTRIQSLA